MNEYVGFVGLGNIGMPMAVTLARAGHKLMVYARKPGPVEKLKATGAQSAESLNELARHCGVIITMVRNAEETREVLFGPGGIVSGAQPGLLVVVMSTIGAEAAVDIAKELESLGIDMIEAPVSGNKRAETGELTIMIGGKEEAIHRAMPFFKSMGKNIFILGDIGSGQRAKVVNNLLLGLHLVAAEEVFELGRQAGLDSEELRKVISVSSGQSWVVDNLDRYRSFWEVVNRPTLEILMKDILLGLSAAAGYKVPLPMSALTYQLIMSRKKPLEPGE